VRAFKFLRAGGVGPFSGFRWPVPTGARPGEWVTPEGAPPPFDDGVHAASVDQLAYWVNQELFEAELEDPVGRERAIVGPRGRLLRRVEVWGPDVVNDFVKACLERADGHATGSGDARDVVVYARSARALAERGPEGTGFSRSGAAVSGFIAAHAAGMRASTAGGDFDEGRAAECTWQSRWLAERLGLRD
jgi:hypothetical protein